MMTQTSYRGIPIIYYDLNNMTKFAELQMIYDKLKVKMPDLVMLPNTAKIVTRDINTIIAVRDYLNQVIEDYDKIDHE